MNHWLVNVLGSLRTLSDIVSLCLVGWSIHLILHVIVIILYYIYYIMYYINNIYIYIILHILCVYIISADLLLSLLYACIIDCPHHPDTVPQVGSLQMWVCLTPLQVIDVGRARVVWGSQKKDSSIWIPGWSFEIIIQQAVFFMFDKHCGIITNDSGDVAHKHREIL